MVGVKVGEEHLGQLGEAHRLHELALGSLAAVEQDAIAAPADEHRRQTAARGGDRARRAGEEDREVHLTQSSAESDELELHAALIDAGHPHGVRRRAPPLGRAARVEDLKPVFGALVQRDVGVPKTTASACGKRRRRRDSRPWAGPASWMSATMAPPASISVVAGSAARTCASSTLPRTATTRP